MKVWAILLLTFALVNCEEDKADEEEVEFVVATPEDLFKLVPGTEDGKLTFEEFVLGEPAVESDFAVSDENEDKKVDLKEFQGFYDYLEEVHKNFSAEFKLPPIEEHFKALDEDSDGFLSVVEFSKADSDMYKHMQEHFKSNDKDGDGAFNEEEFVEFINTLEEVHKASLPHPEARKKRSMGTRAERVQRESPVEGDYGIDGDYGGTAAPTIEINPIIVRPVYPTYYTSNNNRGYWNRRPMTSTSTGSYYNSGYSSGYYCNFYRNGCQTYGSTYCTSCVQYCTSLGQQNTCVARG